MTPQAQNKAVVLFPSKARTTAQDSGDQVNEAARGIQVILDVTATAAGTGGLTVRIQGKDPSSGKYYSLHAAPTAVVATGTKVYEVRPQGGTAVGDVTQSSNGQLPRTFKVIVGVGDATSYTYSVGVNLLV